MSVNVGVGTFDRAVAVALHKAAASAGWPVETAKDDYSREWDVRPDADGNGGVRCPLFGSAIWIVSATVPRESVAGWLGSGPIGLASCWPGFRAGVSDDGRVWWAT